jgi:cathepsin F
VLVRVRARVGISVTVRLLTPSFRLHRSAAFFATGRAFSTVGNIEGQRAIASQGATLESLSVEQLVECDDTVGVRSVDGVMEGSCGVFGGWPYLAYEWLIKAGGVRTDKSMPYCSGIQYGQPGGCLPCMTKGYNTTLCGNHSDLFCNTSTTLGQGPKGLCKSAEGSVAQLKGWRRVGNNATAIADELVATGPLSIALDATIAFQFYKRGVLRPSSHPILGGCGKDPELNHAVLLVGYGTDGGKDYWTIKK